jgi:hypothetical protein
MRDSPRFTGLFLVSGFSCSQALFTLTTPQVTHTVGPHGQAGDQRSKLVWDRPLVFLIGSRLLLFGWIVGKETERK